MWASRHVRRDLRYRQLPLLALGAAFAILTAGADLSSGRMVGIAAVLSASLLQAPDYLRLFYPDLYKTWLWVHMPWATLWVAILAAVLVCAVFGFLNGWTIAQFGVAPFIATLGAFAWIYGMNGLYFDKEPNNSQPIGGLREDFTAIGTGSIPAQGKAPCVCRPVTETVKTETAAIAPCAR